MLVAVDQRIERDRVDETFVDQKRLERLDPKGEVGGDCLVFVVVMMIVSHALSSCPRRRASLFNLSVGPRFCEGDNIA